MCCELMELKPIAATMLFAALGWAAAHPVVARTHPTVSAPATIPGSEVWPLEAKANGAKYR
jgi:hypothetical protein